MEPAPLAAVPDPPQIEVTACDEPDCTYSGGPHGMQVHKARSHKGTGRAPSAQKRASIAPPKPPTPKPAAPTEAVIIAVAILDGQDVRLVGATFTTDLDAQHAERLLTDLGFAPVRIPAPTSDA